MTYLYLSACDKITAHVRYRTTVDESPHPESNDLSEQSKSLSTASAEGEGEHLTTEFHPWFLQIVTLATKWSGGSVFAGVRRC